MRIRTVILLAACLVLVFGLWVWRALTPPSPLAASADGPTLHGVTVINPMVERLSDATLEVRSGRIVRLAADAGAASGKALVEYRGGYVLPGLIDMHAHLPPDNPLKLSGYFAFLYLSHGVTSIRDAGDGDGTSVATARAGLQAGAFPGPRIFSCGPFVVGGKALRWPNSLIVETPADAERVATTIKAAGHICIKAYEDLSVEKLDALKDAARRHGLQLLGHVPTALSYEEALLPDVQHFLGVPPPQSLGRDHILDRAADWHAVNSARLDRIVEVTLQHDIINTPTLVSSHQLRHYHDYQAALHDPVVQLVPRLYPAVVWSPTEGMPFWRGVEDYLPRIDGALAKKRELLRRLYQAGARLQLGSDSQQPFVVPGISLQQEMRLFAEVGVPVEEVWAMATWKAAGRMPLPELGSLREGAPADFLVFTKDPTKSLEALDTLQAVVADGKLYTRADIDAARNAYRAHFRSAIVDAISVPAARAKLDATVLRDY